MKNLKTFEEINTSSEPKVNDFVLCEEFTDDDDLNIFVKNNIGQIIRISGEPFELKKFIVEYTNITNIPERSSFRFTKKNQRVMYLNEIKYWSENIEDLKSILQTNKYNL